MGISGLLPALASITRKTNIQEFSGKRVAVDAYVWLHRCAVSCSFELCTNTPTDKYVFTYLNQSEIFCVSVTPQLQVSCGLHENGKAITTAQYKANSCI